MYRAQCQYSISRCLTSIQQRFSLHTSEDRCSFRYTAIFILYQRCRQRQRHCRSGKAESAERTDKTSLKHNLLNLQWYEEQRINEA